MSCPTASLTGAQLPLPTCTLRTRPLAKLEMLSGLHKHLSKLRMPRRLWLLAEDVSICNKRQLIRSARTCKAMPFCSLVQGAAL